MWTHSSASDASASWIPHGSVFAVSCFAWYQAHCLVSLGAFVWSKFLAVFDWLLDMILKKQRECEAGMVASLSLMFASDRQPPPWVGSEFQLLSSLPCEPRKCCSPSASAVSPRAADDPRGERTPRSFLQTCFLVAVALTAVSWVTLMPADRCHKVWHVHPK